MTGPAGRLPVVTAACAVMGLAAVVAAWRNAAADGFRVLTTAAAGWPGRRAASAP